MSIINFFARAFSAIEDQDPPMSERSLEALDAEAPGSGRWVPLQDAPGRCNGCGRSFHPIHINCYCPAGCGGRVLSS